MFNRFCLGALLLAGLTLTFTSCNISSGLDSITISPNTVTVTLMPPGAPQGHGQFTAIGYYGHAGHQTTVDITDQVTWSSSLTQVATINSSGLATATGFNPATGEEWTGFTNITASAKGYNGIILSNSATFTVTACTACVDTDVSSVIVIPASQTVATVGVPIQFEAIGLTISGASVPLSNTAGIKWTSSVPSIASINATTGVATSVGSGTTTITATFTNTDGSGAAGSATLTVAPSGSPEPLVSLAIVPASQTLTAAGQTAGFIAIGSTSNGSTVNLTNQTATIGTATIQAASWKSSVPSVATINAATGVATSVTSGTTAITAVATNPDGTVVTGTAILTVNITSSIEPLVSLAIVPGSQTLTAAGQTANFIAIGTTSSGTTVNLTNHTATIGTATIQAASWKSSVPSVATVNAATGVATSVTNGTTAITATASNPDGTVVTGVATLTVSIPGSPEPLASLAIVPGSQTLTAANQTAGFIAIGTTTYGTTVNLTNTTATIGTATIQAATWSSSIPSVATINAATGVVTAHVNGVTAITAMATNPDGTVVTGVATLTVNITSSIEPLVSLAIVPSSQTVTQGNQIVGLIAIGTTSSGTTVNLTNQTATIGTATIQPAAWSSSVPSVATVNPTTGVATSVAAGTTAITAIAKNPDGTVVTGVATLTVNITGSPEPLVSLAISPSSQTVQVGNQTANFIAIGTLGSGGTVNLTNKSYTLPGTSPAETIAAAVWSSSNPAVATIDPALGIINAKAVGATAITAIATNPNDGTVVTGSAVLTVTAAVEPWVSLVIVPASQTSLTTGTTANVNFIAIGTNAAGETVNVTSAAAWSSSNPAVATICTIGSPAPCTSSTNGVATPLGAGATAIIAMVGNPDGSVVTASAAYTVTVPTVTEPYVSLAIIPASQSVSAAGQQAQYIALGTTGSGTTVDLTTQATWSSSVLSVATITAPGQATAGTTSGASAITAEYANLNPTTHTPDGTVVTATAVLNVAIAGSPEKLISMLILPSAQSVAAVGQQAQFLAIGDFSNSYSNPGEQNMAVSPMSTDYTVAWFSSNPQVAAVNSSGVVTAEGQGTSVITAVATNNTDHSGTTATATFTVTGPASEPISALTIFPSAQSITLPLPGSPLQTAQFIAIGTIGSGGPQESVTSLVNWSSTNPLVATINSAGVATALSQGSTTITAVATNPDHTIVTATATLTVANVVAEPLLSISILPPSQSLASPGLSTQLIAIGTFSSAPITQDVTKGISSYPITISWSSSNPAVATVCTTGVVCPATGHISPGLVSSVGQGTAAITAVASNPDGTLVTSTVPFTVVGGTSEQFSALTIYPGSQAASAVSQQSQFIVMGTSGTSDLQYDVTNLVQWCSSNATIASIVSTLPGSATCANTTGTTPGLVTALFSGATTITATYTNPDHSQVIATASYSVSIGAAPEPLLSITIIPGGITVGQILDSGNFLAFGNYSTTPTVRDITNEVVWISSAPDVFPIESAGVPGAQAGVATAYGEGSVTIIAEMVRPAICATNPIPTPSVCLDSNPDGTVVTQTATFSCPIGQCGLPVAAQLATLTVYNAGQNSTTWLVTAPSNTNPAYSLIHCGPASPGDGLGASVCIGTYPIGSTVTLTETAPGSSFGGWSENCGGYNPITMVYTPDTSPTCTITLDSNETVGAIFN